MGTKKRKLHSRAPVPFGAADALFTKVQQRVLAILFGYHARSFYANELIALARSGSGAVQRELAQLEAADLVTVRRIGNQKHYQANLARGRVRKIERLHCALVSRERGVAGAASN